jgi:hypothetical protein
MRKNPVDSTFMLLSSYSFEITEANIDELIFFWLSLYPSKWVVAAIVEAIYQGRYKVESVSRILNSWGVRGYPMHHFDYDFADVVCKKLANLSNANVSLTYPQRHAAMESIPSTTPNTQPSFKTEPSATAEAPKRQIASQHTPNQNISRGEKLVIRLSA